MNLAKKLNLNIKAIWYAMYMYTDFYTWNLCKLFLDPLFFKLKLEKSIDNHKQVHECKTFFFCEDLDVNQLL